MEHQLPMSLIMLIIIKKVQMFCAFLAKRLNMFQERILKKIFVKFLMTILLLAESDCEIFNMSARKVCQVYTRCMQNEILKKAHVLFLTYPRADFNIALCK